MTQEKKPVEIGEVIGNIRGSKVELMPAAQHKIDLKTKPLGALGTIEDLAVKMALIKGDLNPSADKKALLVFAGDHGVAEEGVSAFPAEVTPQMVQNFLNGGAAINILCKHHNIDISVIDMGVNYDFGSINGLIDMKVRKGTRNFAHEEAMTSEEVVIALENGMTVLLEKYIENWLGQDNDKHLVCWVLNEFLDFFRQFVRFKNSPEQRVRIKQVFHDKSISSSDILKSL